MQFNKLAGEFLVVEEKLDGTGVSIFFDDQLEMHIWHRGSPATGKEFARLHSWALSHQDKLFDLLENRYVLFGEWMFYKHTIFYDQLPCYFFESDMYDRKGNIWLSTLARSVLLSGHDYIRSVPVLASLKPTRLSQLTDLIKKPLFQSEHWQEFLWKKAEKGQLDLEKALMECDRSCLSEGLYIKHEDDRRVVGRYKYVRRDFVENIINSGSHLIDRVPMRNLTVQEAWL